MEHPTDRPIVRVALDALALLHPTDREHARQLLATWTQRHLLSDAERERVLAEFPEGDSAAGNSGPGGPLPGEIAQASAELPHPRWCDRNNCSERLDHRSAAMHTAANLPDAIVVDVTLVQSLHPAADPMVLLVATDEPDTEHIVMSIGQARVLRYRLGALIDLATRGRR